MSSHNEIPMQWPRLERNWLSGQEAEQFRLMLEYPIKVLQVGEGNFLRGFFDWMIHQLNLQELFQGSIAVTQPRPHGAAKLAELSGQDGLYYQMIRGIQDGKRIDEKQLISVFSRVIDPYSDWKSFLALAENPDLEIVVSNTTEAGLVYQKSDWNPDEPILSFPGKLTLFLYRRFQFFSGDPGKGLLLFPCELLEKNGDKLKHIVLTHADDWKLPDAFKQWIDEHNQFLNSLVDRIVTGYPEGEASELFGEWQVEDRLLNAAEPYYLWAIEGNAELDRRLPFREAGLNVHWVDDLRPFQLRKVRILNGTHTLLTSIGLLRGLNEVREAVEHPEFGPLIRRAVMEEIVPAVPLDTEEMLKYAEDVLERFQNPFIKHRLSDIAMNSFSKFKVRLLPTLAAYIDQTGELPSLITESLASLIALYQVKKVDGNYLGRQLSGETIPLKDDAALLDQLAGWWEQVAQGAISLDQLVIEVLGSQQLWGRNLNDFPELAERISTKLKEWSGKGL
jgi:tagaturonate reductase